MNLPFKSNRFSFAIFFTLFCSAFLSSYSQVKVVSWNVENLGKSKTATEIKFIAKILKDFDVAAIQEVVAGDGGAQTVAQLADELNRMGSKWDYVFSDPTSSSAYKSERYAFLWKTAIVKKIGTPWLEQKYTLEIDREPFYCTFDYKGKQFTLVNFHAITKNLQPETEIKYFKLLPDLYPTLNLLFAGDFNCPQTHSVFNPLKKMGYLPLLSNQKTTLKKQAKYGEYLHSEFDNMFYSTKVTKLDGGVILFYTNFQTLAEARNVSDHIPIWMKFSLN